MADPQRPAAGGAAAEEIRRQLTLARDLAKNAEEARTEAHRLLAALRPAVTQARLRGQINRQIWELERAAGRRPHFFSQAGQDAWLEERVFRSRRGGTFVEIGGYDGISGSNCLFFELVRGWSGLLIEPSPTFHARAAALRRVRCLQVAIAAEEGEAEFLEVQEGYSQMSGLTASYAPEARAEVEADPRHRGALIRVRMRPLAAVLDEHGLERIDYVSLDVEGGEMEVLRNFPFERFAITAWTIENNTASAEIPALMRERGYVRAEALGVDDVYVLRSAWAG